MVVMNVLRWRGRHVALIGGFIVTMWSLDAGNRSARRRLNRPRRSHKVCLRPRFCDAGLHHGAPVDALYFFLVALTAFFTLLISAWWSTSPSVPPAREGRDGPADPRQPQARDRVDRHPPGHRAVHLRLEREAFLHDGPPAGRHARRLRRRQAWMWKFQHPTTRRGERAARAVGTSVKLTMTSQDVIHDVYIPDFRVKAECSPALHAHVFKATKPGRYRLFCAEYCGTNHSGMVGWVVVQERAEYQKWLAGGPGGHDGQTGRSSSRTSLHHLPQGGHDRAGPDAHRPLRQGGDARQREDRRGRRGVPPRVDREPARQDGHRLPAIMPTFQGLISEEAAAAHRVHQVAEGRAVERDAARRRRGAGAAPEKK